MREIKFRGRRIDNGEWVLGCLVVDPDLQQYMITGIEYYNGETGLEREIFHYEVDPDTVGQYTGRKAMVDEKEIYQGDVLTFVIFNHDGSDQGVKTGYVDWSDDAAAWIVRESIDSEDGWWLYLVLGNDDGVEIIGNIHEHPHLLKGEEA